MILDLCYYGNPILRQVALPVSEITEEIRQFCFDMIETMTHTNGIGLAAPQVGRLLRIFVSNLDYEDEQGELHYMETPRVYINPVISHASEVMVERGEGCLSIPKLHCPVIRPISIELEALDIDGNLFHEGCYGYQARNRMHENDHLNGVLYIDRIKGKARTKLEPMLRSIKKNYN